MRSVSRFWLIRNPSWDDWLIIAAMIMSIGYVVNLFIGRTFNVGFPIYMLSFEDMTNILKVRLMPSP